MISINVKNSDQSKNSNLIIKLLGPKDKLLFEVKQPAFKKQFTVSINGTYSLCLSNKKNLNTGISFTFNNFDNFNFEPADIEERDSKDMMIMI